MSAENVEIVARIQAALAPQDIVQTLDDPEVGANAGGVLAELAEPDFEVAMVGPDYLPRPLEARGSDGFTALWADWASAYESLEIEIEQMIDAGDKVVSLVRQRGRTRTGGVEIEAQAAAVWTLADGKLRRVEFHLERDSALRAAGLDTQSSQE